MGSAVSLDPGVLEGPKITELGICTAAAHAGRLYVGRVVL